jgi:ATP/ADP translocase
VTPHEPTTVGALRRPALLVAPLTAAALIAQQVASNAVRDALFLTWFQVTSLPYFMAAAAVLSIPAAESSGRLLARFGPARVVPSILGLNSLLFLIEWSLLSGNPRVASGLVYVHASVLGAIGISAFWSLLNERFDPHSAKALMARVAAAAAFGGLAGGVGAERVTVLMSQGALFLLLGLSGGACVAGSVFIGRGMPARRTRMQVKEERRSGWTEIRRVPLLRELALVVALAAALAALTDYLLKAEVVSYFGKGEPLVRFFGLFYAGTALAAFLLQALLGRAILARIGLGGSVASHPLLVGAAAVLGFFAPAPWRAIFPRGLDVTLRASIFRAGYELFYTPLAEASKRAAKSAVDVTADCLGKGAGAALIVLLTRFDPLHTFVAVNIAAVLAAVAEFTVARRLRAQYVSALERGLKRQAEDLQQATPRFDFTVAASMMGLDAVSIRRALDNVSERKGNVPHDDPVVAAIASLRSGDMSRILHVLRAPPTDPLLVGALVPLLANREILKQVVKALSAYGTRATGQLVDALLDPETPDVVRRRLPFVLKSCASSLARDGLVQALATPSFEVRLRCGRALLALTDKNPELALPPHVGFQAVERELTGGNTDAAARELVFNLLALVLEREPVKIAALAFDSDDTYLRGTALEYLETVLPSAIFAALAPRLATAPAQLLHQRGAAVLRAELLEAGATMRVSRKQLLTGLSAPDLDDEG